MEGLGDLSEGELEVTMALTAVTSVLFGLDTVSVPILHAEGGDRTEVDMSETVVCSAPGLLKARESLTGARQNKLAAHGVESLQMEGKHHLDFSTRAATEEPRSGVDMSETAVYSALHC